MREGELLFIRLLLCAVFTTMFPGFRVGCLSAIFSFGPCPLLLGQITLYREAHADKAFLLMGSTLLQTPSPVHLHDILWLGVSCCRNNLVLHIDLFWLCVILTMLAVNLMFAAATVVFVTQCIWRRRIGECFGGKEG
jgi:hypothetical protein